jgi:hypothetical protein
MMGAQVERGRVSSAKMRRVSYFVPIDIGVAANMSEGSGEMSRGSLTS